MNKCSVTYFSTMDFFCAIFRKQRIEKKHTIVEENRGKQRIKLKCLFVHREMTFQRGKFIDNAHTMPMNDI